MGEHERAADAQKDGNDDFRQQSDLEIALIHSDFRFAGQKSCCTKIRKLLSLLDIIWFMETSSIESLKAGIAELLSRYETLSREHAELSDKWEEACAEINRQTLTIKELEERINKLQLDSAFSTASPDRAEAKRKVSRMIRQIDRCIALLDE